MPTWLPGNDGTGKRKWFVYKYSTRQYLETKNGRLIRFKSCAVARKRAETLNAEEA